MFIGGAIGTFPLFVPPFFIPLFANAVGLSSATGAGLLAGFNFASAVGRILSGFLCDKIGPLNALFLSLSLAAISMLAVWPVSTTLAPLAVFSVVNGMANGGFFSTMPTVVGNCFGSARVSIAMVSPPESFISFLGSFGPPLLLHASPKHELNSYSIRQLLTPERW